MKRKQEQRNIEDMLTSELIYHSSVLEDQYGTEYLRRMRLLRVDECVIDTLYTAEKMVLKRDKDVERRHSWARRIFILLLGACQWPKPEDLTMSELCVILDEKQYQLILHPEFRRVFGPKYGPEVEQRFTEVGWNNIDQSGLFGLNEEILLGRLKWKYHNEHAWTEQTIDLAFIERNLKKYHLSNTL